MKKPLLRLPLAALVLVVPAHRAAAQMPDSGEARARALHVLNRVTFGPRPGDVDRVLAMGIDRFVAQQLAPERIADTALDRRLKSFEVLRLSPGQIAALDRAARQERQRRQRVQRDSGSAPAGPPAERMPPASVRRLRRLAGETQQLAVLRAIESEHQLYEVMVDFWVNHFNVFLGKGPVRTVLPSYVEDVIRPRALGRFEDLLVAIAQSPAMLLYLDNAQSVVEGAVPPGLARQRRQERQRRQGRQAAPPMMNDSVRARIEARMPRGINENYAREVLELHTLGVDGGYTQADVENVARILTGWSVTNIARGDPRFVFNSWAHDTGAKSVLGTEFRSGRGVAEGLELLELLAGHPSTMRHVSAKLCARFVNDEPPAGCIDAGVHAWERTGGDIREVVRAIIASPDFWSPDNRAAKIKTPLEFVASAVRAVGGHADTTLALGQVVGRLGQPLYLYAPPTGYPETQEDWVNSGALLERMNFAVDVAGGRLRGVAVDLDAVAPARADHDALIVAVNRSVLGGAATVHTLDVMRRQLESVRDPRQARALAVGLALGSPEFQKQ